MLRWADDDELREAAAAAAAAAAADEPSGVGVDEGVLGGVGLPPWPKRVIFQVKKKKQIPIY